ncbi:MAG: hypothetical protein AAGF93_08875 [Cyanobacteria bacterium P01_H01_bin.105]
MVRPSTAVNQLEYPIIALIPKFFVHPYFRSFGVPFLTLFLIISFKSGSRKSAEIYLEDLLVGVDLCIISLVIFSIGLIDEIGYSLDSLPSRAIQELLRSDVLSAETVLLINSTIAAQSEIIDEKIYLSFIVLLLMFLYTSILSFLIREFGWRADNKPKFFSAILVPNIMGLMLLILASWWVSF